MSSGGPVIVSAYPPPVVGRPSSVISINSFHTSHSPLKTSKGEGEKRRVHSAQPGGERGGRIQSTQPLSSSSSSNNEDIREPIDLPRRKRVQSAIEPRQVVSVSLGNTPYGSTVWGQTSYRSDYEKRKPIPLPKVRPASATRMNNPHPSHVRAIYYYYYY